MILHMDVLRILLGALIVAALVAVGAAVFDPTRARDPEEAVRQELTRDTDAQAMAARINGALDQGKVDDASMYAEIARFAGFAIPQETQERLDRELSNARMIVRETGSFIGGFITGDADDVAALAGAVTADLTVVGDVRDIAAEGTKLVAGKPYNELVLGLSVVGVALTTATLATGGGALPAKAGVSVLKVAKRAGHLTADFTRVLGRLVRDAVDPPRLARTLRETRLSNSTATRAAVEAYTEHVRTAALFPTLAKVERIRETAGAGEAVRLMRYVRTTDDLDDVTAMSKVLGKKTRGVIEITGKTSLRLFKGGFKILALILENILAFLSWLGSLVALMLSRRVFRLLPI
jgi:hypothetical protein